MRQWMLEPDCLDSNPASATCYVTLEESPNFSGLSCLYLHQGMAKDRCSDLRWCSTYTHWLL